MGVRETLNERPVLTTGLTVVIIIGALVFLVSRWMHPSVPVSKFPTKAYYSDDDGKTWYIDDASNIPPYDHNGKQAYRAIIFRCGDKAFVQRLEGYDEQIKARIQQQISGGAAPLAAQYMYANDGMIIKKPGDKDWVKLEDKVDAVTAKKWSDVMKPVCPDGSMNARPVSVEEDAKPE